MLSESTIHQLYDNAKEGKLIVEVSGLTKIMAKQFAKIDVSSIGNKLYWVNSKVGIGGSLREMSIMRIVNYANSNSCNAIDFIEYEYYNQPAVLFKHLIAFHEEVVERLNQTNCYARNRIDEEKRKITVEIYRQVTDVKAFLTYLRDIIIAHKTLRFKINVHQIKDDIVNKFDHDRLGDFYYIKWNKLTGKLTDLLFHLCKREFIKYIKESTEEYISINAFSDQDTFNFIDMCTTLSERTARVAYYESKDLIYVLYDIK